MFLHFYAFEHLIRGNQPEFLMVRSGLEKYHPRKKKRVLLTNFRKLSNGYFLKNYGEPLYQHISKNEILSKPLRYHKIQEYKRFLAAFSVLQGARLSTYEIFNVARGQKRALCSFDY